MPQDSKRQLLAEVLTTGKLDKLRDYHQRKQANGLNINCVIDSRQCGGTIEVLYWDGRKETITPEALAALPNSVGKWVIKDFTGGRPVPAPDEDY